MRNDEDVFGDGHFVGAWKFFVRGFGVGGKTRKLQQSDGVVGVSFSAILKGF